MISVYLISHPYVGAREMFKLYCPVKLGCVLASSEGSSELSLSPNIMLLCLRIAEENYPKTHFLSGGGIPMGVNWK